jgi:hypothetical protein
MPSFPNSLRAWPSESFAEALKQEIQAVGIAGLPVATTQGGHVDEQEFSVMVLVTQETADAIEARVGVFFSEILGGCNCSEDPVESNSYCELIVAINKKNALTELRPGTWYD